MDEYTVKYLKRALFEHGEFEIKASDTYNDMGLSWNDLNNLERERIYEPNEGWFWDGNVNVRGITWGGCLEVIDDLLRCAIQIPSLEDFKNIVLITETSEDIPESEYVFSVYRALGERGILERVRAVLVGRPKAWEFNKPNDKSQKDEYRKKQRETILKAIRMYNTSIPVVQNLDFGHTDPQISLPYGMPIRVNSIAKQIFVEF